MISPKFHCLIVLTNSTNFNITFDISQVHGVRQQQGLVPDDGGAGLGPARLGEDVADRASGQQEILLRRQDLFFNKVREREDGHAGDKTA